MQNTSSGPMAENCEKDSGEKSSPARKYKKKYTFEMFEGFHRNPANHQDGDGGAQPHTTPIGLRDSRTALGADAARRGSAPVCAGGPRRTDKEGGGGGAVDDH